MDSSNFPEPGRSVATPDTFKLTEYKQMESYVRIGTCKKPHGLHGEVKVWLDEPYEEDFEQAEVLFIGEVEPPIPYFVEYIRTGGFYRLKLEDIQDREEAFQLNGASIFLRESDLLQEGSEGILSEEEAESIYFNWVGYDLIDEELGLIGEIQDIQEFPSQIMAIVLLKEKEVFIPMNESLIVSHSASDKTVRMNLPQGILDL